MGLPSLEGFRYFSRKPPANRQGNGRRNPTEDWRGDRLLQRQPTGDQGDRWVHKRVGHGDADQEAPETGDELRFHVDRVKGVDRGRRYMIYNICNAPERGSLLSEQSDL